MKTNYIIDTNTLIFFFKGKFNVRDKILSHHASELGVSEITIAELTYGAYHSKNYAKHIKEAEMVKETFTVFPIAECFDEYGQIRDYLRKQGLSIENFDLLIAATAVHYGLTLVTDNLQHFNRIPNLKIENWVNRNK